MATAAAASRRRARKVVLAREVRGRGRPPLRRPGDVLGRLRPPYPGCCVFPVDGFVGASPELLVAARRRRRALAPHGRHRAPQRRPDDRRPPGRRAPVVGQGPRRAPGHDRHGPRHAAPLVLVPRRARPSRRSCPWPTCSTWPPWSRAGCRARRRRCSSWCGALHPTPAVCGRPAPTPLALIRALRGLRPRPLRRHRRLGRRRRQRRLGRRHPRRRGRRHPGPALRRRRHRRRLRSRRPSWPRPGPSSRRSSAPSSGPDAPASARRRDRLGSAPRQLGPARSRHRSRRAPDPDPEATGL